MSAEPPVLVEQDGHVLLVTLNRPDKRNAINCESMCLLDDAWRRLDRDDDVRVAILTGNGSTFCAGMDLKEIALLGQPEPADEHIARVQADTEIIGGPGSRRIGPPSPSSWRPRGSHERAAPRSSREPISGRGRKRGVRHHRGAAGTVPHGRFGSSPTSTDRVRGRGGDAALR